MKRVYCPLLYLSIFMLLVVLSVLHETISSNAMTERASTVEAVAGRSVLPVSEQLVITPNYMLQAGTGGTASLVGEWRFDEANGTSAADSSGRALNATLQNGAAWASGRYRAGLRFDGVDDYVQVGAPAALVMTNTMSISAWIYPTGTGSAGLGIIVNKEGEYEIARFYDGTIRWAFANSAPGWNFIDTGFVAPTNQWTHLTVTYNNGEVKTYANGNLVHTYLGNGAIGDVGASLNDFRIGGRQNVAQYFMGLIDEVSIYNQALTATDITKLSQGSMLRNLALRKPATQSSTGWDSPASLAVDGNTDSDWFHGSVSHTDANDQAWWQVDLGSVQQIDNVSVWLMTVCCSSHDNFDVKVSSDGSNWTSYYVAGPVDQVNVPVNRAARYVRVQLRGSGYLALGEVQVWGVPGAVIPGVVQAEDFDDGGEGISYHDFSAANEGGLYRNTAVDVSSCVANNYVIGWNGSGEWTQYNINVLKSGNYIFQAVIGEESATGSLHVEIDGVDRTGPITIPATGSYCTYQTISKGGISLSPGQHTMRVVTDNVGVVLDSFSLVQTTPYSGTPATIPGTIQVEAYDNGPEGLAYHDNSPSNESGSTFRAPTGVDVWEGGIGYAQAGEWLLYTVNVTTTGTYTVGVSVTAPTSGAAIHVEIDGVDKTGPMIVPNTGGWNSYQTITKSGVPLTAGPHTMRLVLDTNSGNGYVANFDLLNFTLTSTNANAAAFTSQSVPASMVAGQLYNVSITMLNTGSNTWTTAGSYNLGTQNPQDNSTWSVTRVALPNSQSVAPGQQVTFTFPIRAPGTAGTYNFQMQMVQDGVAWFGAPTANVVVTVAPPNQLPKANAGTSQASVVGYPVQFSSNGSYDPDGTIAFYSWNFGDGQTASDANPSHTYSAVGNYVVTLKVTDNAGATSTATVTVAVIDTTQASYLNNSKVPGTIQAEDFNNGGAEVAYHDDSLGNQGGSATYRAGENVDVEDNTATSGGYVVGWTRPGEWLNYIVRVADADDYKFEAQVASPLDGGTGGVFHLDVDGGNVTGPITVPNTGGAWTTVSKSGIRLSAGMHVLRVVMDSGGSTGYVGRFDYFRFTATQTPYGGTARALPGTIQVEDFDNGPQGTSYSDTTAGNQGGAYRSTDVDIWNSSEGPAVGWGQKGEWLDYTVDVSQNDSYTFAVRVASPGAGATFHLEIDDFIATAAIAVPATGSRNTWQTVQTSVKLTTGRHILRLVVDDPGAGGEVCFNSFTVSIPAKDPTKVPVADALEIGGEPYPNFDYKVFGVGDLRFNSPHSDNGDFVVSGIKNVRHAFLFWWGVPTFLRADRVVFADQTIFGDRIAPAWRGEFYPGAESWSYRADVTGIVAKLGNIKYHITTTSCYGASLIVLYDDGDASNNRDISIYAWNDGNELFRRPDGYVDPKGWDTTLKDVNYAGAGAKVQLHVAGGQRQQESLLTFSNANVPGRQITYPQPNGRFDPLFPDIFWGNSVPPLSLVPGGATDGLWDIIDFDVTGILNSGKNNVRITADQGPDMLFLVLAVVNQPHVIPAVNITDPRTDQNVRVDGSLNNTLQKSLIGSRVKLTATGNSTGSYQWTFTGPARDIFLEDNNRTVSFTTFDDDRGAVTQKTVYRVTPKVTFTNSQGVKVEAIVNIDVQVPTVPDYSGIASDSTIELGPTTTFNRTNAVIWQMGGSNPDTRKPGMTFSARAQIPDGRYLSDLNDASITFQQAINMMRKVRDSWGKESCKTTREKPEDAPVGSNGLRVDTGWRFDSDLSARVSQVSGATKKFNESATTSGVANTRSLSIDFKEGVEGIKFNNMHIGFNEFNGNGLSEDLIDVDAVLVDDWYQTYVMYSSGGGTFSRPLATVEWKWGGTLVFDTTHQTKANGYDPEYAKLPVGDPASDYYVLTTTTSSLGKVDQKVIKTTVAGVIDSPQIPWMQCPLGLGKPHPADDDHPITDNHHGFVELLYIDALERVATRLDLSFLLEPSPDMRGYHYWASKIIKNIYTKDNDIEGERVHTAMAFLFAGDFVKLHQKDNDPLKDLSAAPHTLEYNAAFVKACYWVFLRRLPGQGPDQGSMVGFNTWFDKLNQMDLPGARISDDYPYFETVHAFLVSEEYQKRVNDDLPDFPDIIIPKLGQYTDDVEHKFNSDVPTVFPTPPQ